MKARHESEANWHRDLDAFWKAPNRSDDYLGDNPFDKFLYRQEAESWEDFVRWFSSMSGVWAFRGQSDADWTLHPSLDRRLRVSGSNEYLSFYQQLDPHSYEQQLLFRFQRVAPQYRSYLPQSSDLTSWLGLMQHHGTPTRLLDWTTSPYVALYFALEKETNTSAIWAINLDWLEDRGNVILQEQGRKRIPTDPFERTEYINKLLPLYPEGDENNLPRMVVSVEPRVTDPWMESQQGFFLCKCWHKASMNQLLMRMMIHPDLISYPTIKKLEIGKNLRFDFLSHLKAANIHRGSLFPSLEGFAQSLDFDLQMEMDRLSRESMEQAERYRFSREADSVQDEQDQE